MRPDASVSELEPTLTTNRLYATLTLRNRESCYRAEPGYNPPL